MADPETFVVDLQTNRLALRRLVVEDTPGVHEAYADAETMRFSGQPTSPDLAETERRIQRPVSVDPQWHATWAIRARAGGHFVGMVNDHARQPWNRGPALGWILVPRFQGLGLMREAVAAVLPHCFGALDTHRIEAEIEPENTRSARFAERLGFRREGLLRDRLFVAGKPRSIQMYGLLRSAWNG
jgi:ribosomal-protein-alanine N-acetyltransferase